MPRRGCRYPVCAPASNLQRLDLWRHRVFIFEHRLSEMDS
jgi:hypothetical protein